MLTENLLIQQHLIDPEICIRCNTCEASCPEGAVTHDDRNYVVDAQKCNHCMACVPPCPTGSIDNWRSMPRAKAYSVEAQLGWDELPPALSDEQFKALGVLPESISSVNAEPHSASHGATVPPWSAAHPYTNLHGPKNPITATVVGNVQVNEAGTANETHHIMLDFGSMPFPVLEGQSIGIVPSGADASGKAHHARQYSVASPRNGERAGYNNLSLTVKRVKEDHQGQAIKGVCSNYLCDLQVGQKVQVIGPFGSSFLMPNHPQSNIVMICTGTGSAPMRAMTEWRRRLRQTGKFEGGKLMLFFGARTQQELPYFAPLQKLPNHFIDITFAFSRTPGQPKRYVQDLMQERAADLGALLKDGNTCIYVCGLKRMEEGVLVALHDVATQAGMNWSDLGAMLQKEGRLHLETY
jgi:benzoyl-CoA 2,3-dioxygenase component A